MGNNTKMSVLKRTIKHELVLSVYYLFASLIAVTLAHLNYTRAYYKPPAGPSQGPIEINIGDMVIALWNDFYRWWFVVFLGFILLRIAFVFLNARRKKNLSSNWPLGME
jgi:hypothetical protein